MRSRWRALMLVAAVMVSAPVAAQENVTGVPTITQERAAAGYSDELPWDLLGLIGLLGLLGLRRGSDNDGYTDDPI